MQHYLSVKDNLQEYMDAGFSIFYIRTSDEVRTDRHIASLVGIKESLEWNGSGSLVDFRTKTSKIAGYPLEKALTVLNKGNEMDHKLLVIKDADKQLESEKITALLKEMAYKKDRGIDATVIIVSPVLHIPAALEKLITVLEEDLPGESRIHDIIDEFENGLNIPPVDTELRERMVTAFKGLEEFEIKHLLGLAVSRFTELDEKAIQLINEQKQQIILKAGMIEMIPLKEGMKDIGGLDNLKKWLQKKAVVFQKMKKAMEFGVDVPKGVLIVGIPGCGKSLSAKAAGKLFDVPLLRMDMGHLMGKYLGESEENMRKALQVAEAISPCILWIDELEKALAGVGGGDGSRDVATRLFGSLLTWMQEKTSAVFVVATANDISKLPPELLRKGRFDEIFYVSLPDKDERKYIFRIHLDKRNKKSLDDGSIELLVSRTNGYSGADIESVINESIENAFINGKKDLTAEDILECIHNTQPLSRIMKESLGKMDKIYVERGFKKA